MQMRQLGRTDLQVSVLGFGASPFGGAFGEISDSDASRMVHAAVDFGINLFDVSPYYGVTRAEKVLGAALQGIDRDQYILATKIGRYSGTEFDFSAKRTIESVDQSLERLQTDCIDLIQCHDIEFGSLDQIVSETIPALRLLRDQGKVRFIGVTGLPLKIFPYVVDRTQVDCVLSYCHYTLYDNSLNSLLPQLVAHRIGIISAAPLGMGLLANGAPPVWHPAPPELRTACKEAAEVCRQHGSDISTLALQYALQNPDISSTLVGIGSMEQLEVNVSCVGTRPDPEMLALVSACFDGVRNTTWPSGLAENN